jgi:hypothetical protein
MRPLPVGSLSVRRLTRALKRSPKLPSGHHPDQAMSNEIERKVPLSPR